MGHCTILQFLNEHVSDPGDLRLMTYEGMLDSTFIGDIADYIGESDREEDLSDFLDYVITELGVNADESRKYITCRYGKEDGNPKTLPGALLTFRPGFKEAFFARRFEEFKKRSEDSKLVNFLDTMFIYSLRQCMESTHGIYIADENLEYQTFDEFVRRLDPGRDTDYWLGSTLDYHM